MRLGPQSTQRWRSGSEFLIMCKFPKKYNEWVRVTKTTQNSRKNPKCFFSGQSGFKQFLVRKMSLCLTTCSSSSVQTALLFLTERKSRKWLTNSPDSEFIVLKQKHQCICSGSMSSYLLIFLCLNGWNVWTGDEVRSLKTPDSPMGVWETKWGKFKINVSLFLLPWKKKKKIALVNNQLDFFFFRISLQIKADKN